MRDRLVTIALSVAATMGLIKAESGGPKELDVDRLIVRKELIVSDTGVPWEKGYEAQQIPRGVYARSVGDGAGGLWVRSRLIKGEIDDPFDDRFHALESNGSLRGAPGLGVLTGELHVAPEGQCRDLEDRARSRHCPSGAT